MPKWDIQRLTTDDGNPRLIPLEESGVSPKNLHRLLEKAAQSSCARPMYSGFRVSGSITNWPWSSGQSLHSGNVEYGYYQAIHNEEAAVVALIATKNTGTLQSPILALVNGTGPGTLATITMPCGNCRDILRDAIGPECALVAGTRDGGVALFCRLSDILFDNYATLPIPWENADVKRIRDIVQKGSSILNNPYSTPNSHHLREYIVCLWTYNGAYSPPKLTVGAAQVGADFHPIYAGEVAVLLAKLERDFGLQEIVIVAEGDGTQPPDVMYRDRQRLCEYAFACELKYGMKPQDTLIRLFTHADGELTGAWKTSMQEWLPLPFTPRSFGDEFLARYTAYLKAR